MTPEQFLHEITHSVLTLFYPEDRKKNTHTQKQKNTPGTRVEVNKITAYS